MRIFCLFIVFSIDFSTLSDTEISDFSPDGEDDKTATVERKVPLKDELDAAIPQHELLDTAVNKSKSDLVSRGGLSKRLPSGKKSLSNSSSDCALNESEEECIADTVPAANSNENRGKPNGDIFLISKGTQIDGNHLSTCMHFVSLSMIFFVSFTAVNDNNNNNGNKKRFENAPLYAQVHKEAHTRPNNDNQNSNNHFVPHSTIPNIYKNASDSTPISATYNNELSSSYDSILSSNDKLSDASQNTDNWTSRNKRRSNKIPPSSFSDQLNQVLSEREL